MPSASVVGEGVSAGSVLVDTSAFYALVDRRDAAHAVAVATARRFAGTRRRLLTTNFVVAETHALLLRRLGREVASAFLDRVDATAAVERAESADEARGRAIVRLHADKDYSLTDAISFAVMERLGLDRAFAYDRHFAQYGFRVLGTESE